MVLKVYSSDLIIVSNILKFSIAFTAWGILAGKIIDSPASRLNDCLPIIILALPSKTWIKASKGAVCSLNFWFLSNAKRVTVPIFLFITILLTIPPVE
jgi:cation transporter-like permease